MYTGPTPYKSNSELPASVRNNLPAHAQEIYRKAFNTAWKTGTDLFFVTL
ncbi:hypothetical protein FMN52_18575 [Marinobacter sp. BW6]|nr:ChaB family protein [Marinobacter sp. BW6]TYC53130.1 hypothetical protein FMN52_18575 [Marinobacter sp. BW6]